jgi:integrase
MQNIMHAAVPRGWLVAANGKAIAATELARLVGESPATVKRLLGELEELQKSLGHTSILTTERAYGHLGDDAAATLARQRIYGIGATSRRLQNAPRGG